jgi:uncharacterized protein YutE (UPF0331/DUF86 family)
MILLVDNERFSKLLSAVRNSLRLLLSLAALPKDDFLKDEHKISSAKYNFIAAIEAVIDINNHVISRNKLRAPNDYADSFAVLYESLIIDKSFADELMKMARFRNRLVHLYWDVDSGELHTILLTRLGDFEQYLTAIGKSISF